jgi:membrane protein required for colicin V production
MNIFDAVVIGCALLAIAFGFNSGFLRSLATILGYLVAAPFAAAVTPPLAYHLAGTVDVSGGRGALVLFAVFLVSGVLIGALMRRAVRDMVGPQVSPLDRTLGAILGAVRVALIAMLMVMIFDRIIPPNLEPAWLTGSRLRPPLSEAGRRGLRALPPDVAAYLDRIKQQLDLKALQ